MIFVCTCLVKTQALSSIDGVATKPLVGRLMKTYSNWLSKWKVGDICIATCSTCKRSPDWRFLIEGPSMLKSAGFWKTNRKLRETKMVEFPDRVSLPFEDPLLPIFISSCNNQILLKNNFLLLVITTFF